MTYNSVERDAQTQTQGGYSDKIVVDENYVLRLPDNISLDSSAPLLCAGITMYSPLMH
jgi:alcohol dehydrogenase (NADP+)